MILALAIGVPQPDRINRTHHVERLGDTIEPVGRIGIDLGDARVGEGELVERIARITWHFAQYFHLEFNRDPQVSRFGLGTRV